MFAMRVILTVIVCLFVTACAKQPEAIAPAYVSPLPYKNYDCDSLAQEGVRIEEALTQVAAQQRGARRNDIAGVIILGLPVSWLSGGNVADQIARLKGEQKMVRQLIIEKKCLSGADK